MTEPKMRHVKNCYGCGKTNPVGLKMTFAVHADHIIGTLLTHTNHAGPPGVVHGGVIAAAVDESFSVFTRSGLGQDALTVRLEMVYRQPAALGTTLAVDVRLKEETRKTLNVKAVVTVEEKVIAEAEGTLFKWQPDNPS